MDELYRRPKAGQNRPIRFYYGYNMSKNASASRQAVAAA